MIQSQVSRFFGGISFSFLLPLREKARMRGTLIGTLNPLPSETVSQSSLAMHLASKMHR